ncbi:MAG: amino acid ABC transporter permease [Bacillota bacterium]|nr:amino acid ABC transporter permease [Bacillota bacterium]
MEPTFAAISVSLGGSLIEMNIFEYIVFITPQMSEGLGTTLMIYALTILPALLLGFALGIVKANGPAPVKGLLGVYTWAWRGTPLLLQLMIMKFGLRYIGVIIPDILGAVIVFTLNMGAYITEIMRGAIQSVDKGQYEACHALGIPRGRMMLRVIIPQSIRIAIPPACSEAINLVKDVAIIAVIGMQDILRVANQITQRDHTIIPYIYGFIVYLLLSSLLVKLFGRLEKRFTSYD